MKQLLQYLAPLTIKEIYQEVNDARLNVFLTASEENYDDQLKEYHDLGSYMDKLEEQYKNLTGEELWAEVAMEK